MIDIKIKNRSHRHRHRETFMRTLDSTTTQQSVDCRSTRNENITMSSSLNSSKLSCINSLQDPSITELTPVSVAWHVTWSNKNGKLLASSHGIPNPCVRIWKQIDDDTWTLSCVLNGIHDRTIRYSSFNSNNTLLASASFDGTISIWERQQHDNDEQENWECIAQLEGHENEVKCVVWNYNDTLLATCGRDKTVWIWECFLNDVVAGGGSNGDGDFDCIAVLHGHEGDVKCLSFASSHNQWGSNEGEDILLSCSYDDTIKVWAEDDGDWYCAATLPSIHTSTIWSISLTSSSLRLVSTSDDGSLAFWKFYTAQENNEQQLLNNESNNNGCSWKCVNHLKNIHSSSIYSIHCSSATLGHGCIVSAGADNTIQIYKELHNNSQKQFDQEHHPQFYVCASANIDHHYGDINSVQWHPSNSSLLCSATDDGVIRIWKYIDT